MTNSLLLNMAIEIVDLPIENGDFLYFFVGLPEGKPMNSQSQDLFQSFSVCGSCAKWKRLGELMLGAELLGYAVGGGNMSWR